jgi:hypothetical protein
VSNFLQELVQQQRSLFTDLDDFRPYRGLVDVSDLDPAHQKLAGVQLALDLEDLAYEEFSFAHDEEARDAEFFDEAWQRSRAIEKGGMPARLDSALYAPFTQLCSWGCHLHL